MKNLLICLMLFSGLQMSAQQNLIDSSTWTIGNGFVSGFNNQGSTAENVRELGTTPHGQSKILWKAVPDAANNGDGGWNTTYKNIDHTKTYRISIWIKKTGSTNGRTYLGFYARDASGSRNSSLRLDGTVNANPYFFWSDLPQLNQWYLIVGYVHRSNYSSTTSLSGIYDTDGNKVVNLIDYKMATTATSMLHRTYLYYNTDTNNRQYFWDPAIYEVNGQEPSIQELVNGPNSSDTQAPTAATLSSPTKTASSVSLSWSGATDNVGVSGYKVFRNNSLVATLGNVNSYTVTGLSANTNYSFTIKSLDAAGNESPNSNVLQVTTSSGSSGGGESVWDTTGSNIHFVSGNVGIGTTTPRSWKLAVNGNIRAKEIKVETANWPDYVFAKNYDLPTLEEIQKHITEKGHLPGMPSATEAEANGIELGEMNRLLLEKVEELTLLLIQERNENKNRELRLIKIERMMLGNK